jgi:hypothetical protein
MKRRTELLGFSAFALVAAVLGVACATSNDPVAVTPAEDASVLPSQDSLTDASVEAGADASVDVDAQVPTCADGWCKNPLPDGRPYGFDPFRITGLAMDGTNTWATTTTFAFDGSGNHAHLLQYEGGTWLPKWGLGISQVEPFPFTFDLNAIASDGKGGFMAVGGAPYGGPGAIVLRIEGGVVTPEYPQNVASGFVALAFSAPGQPWALDGQGFLYRNVTGDDGTSTWNLEPAPHMADPVTFSKPNVLFATTVGSIAIAGTLNGTWGDDGFVPGYQYVDIRSEDADAGVTWRTSKVPCDYSFSAGVESAPSKIWLATNNSLIGSQPDADAGDNGGLAWAPIAKPIPILPEALWARSATDVFAVGPVGRIYHYDGSDWSDAKLALNGAPFTTNELKAIAGLPSGEMWVGGFDVALHFAPPVGP